ncbi:hypothetical protein HYDPIDRAFT_115014 [Hydnomerulius pinastri MD-312]|uniref:Uncharacterized protein n=1 Tax=Hydnomerulius pinastri MD-312 TaxID=994086 RepID=A0A0C9VVL9_9AGAM|nr:hypothetical protein HYDPIDRAFT_115014 [Hydnomerulius pinastri MD-312]
MRLIALTSLALALVASSIPVITPSNANDASTPALESSMVTKTPDDLNSFIDLEDRDPSPLPPHLEDPTSVSQPSLSGNFPRATAPLKIPGLNISGTVAGLTSSSSTLAAGPLSGTNDLSASGILHGASDAGGTSGNGTLSELGSVTGVIPGGLGSGTVYGGAQGKGTYLQSAANNGPSGSGVGSVGGGVKGNVGPVSGGVGVGVQGSPSIAV